ncbi:hypothetical protein K458DRAFT_429374 [Lentithecium fluviatile CBS 122367]|uniref:C2H2-type domain-containing protein n=1 Tax=Lentithecium fluviatile CBS 122367 TaxID=1168545 RepID=A0A6G1JAA6_9PLEO|nr:hypothetical protein K458DRAFT_429374 [Lentithecium fluviatile CBS 122367]
MSFAPELVKACPYSKLEHSKAAKAEGPCSPSDPPPSGPWSPQHCLACIDPVEGDHDGRTICPKDFDLGLAASLEVDAGFSSFALPLESAASGYEALGEYQHLQYGGTGHEHSFHGQTAESGRHPPSTSSRRAAKDRILPIKIWLQENASWPYASKGDLERLAEMTGLSSKKVRVCLNNLRQRMKANEASGNSIGALHSLGTFQAPEAFQTGFELDDLSSVCFSDWLSPSGFKDISGDEPFTGGSHHTEATVDADIFAPMAHGVYNLDTFQVEAEPISLQASAHPMTKPKRKGKRSYASRYNASAGQTSSPSASEELSAPTQESKKPYQCTSCLQSFKDAYGWKRHEIGVHGFHVQEWICMNEVVLIDGILLHGILLDGNLCVLCGQEVLSFDHFQQHNVNSCLNKEQAERTFARKDLFRQHVRQVHLTTADEDTKKRFVVPESWVQDVDATRSSPASLWCGFCQLFLDSTAIRMDHIADHFRDGLDMNTWQPICSELSYQGCA